MRYSVALSLCLWATSALADDATPPEPVAPVTASWPGTPEARELGVPVLVVVSAEGNVTEANVETSVGAEYDEKALEAARRWKFTPAKRDGVNVAARIRILIRFVAAPSIASVPEPKPETAPAPPAGKHDHDHDHDHAADHDHDQPHASPDAVNVHGQRAPVRSASETVIDARVKNAAPHRTASDLLFVVPGVFVSQHSGEGKAHQIFFRGFDAVHGQDIEIWAGGAPVNDVSNIHGQGYADLHFVMPEVVKEIRSLPGNYDAEQGDFAVAGTLKFTLGYDEPGVTAKAGFGTFGTRRYFLAYHPKEASDSTFAAVEAYKTDGFGPARAAQRASAMGQTTFALGGAATARVMASTYAGRFDSAGVLRLSDIESGKVDRFDTYDSKQGGYSSRSQLVVDVGEQSESAHWSIAPYVIWRSFQLRSNFTGYLENPEGDSVQQVNDSTTVGAHAHYRRFLQILSDHDSLEAGVFLRSDSIEQSQQRLAIANDAVLETEVDAKVHATDAAGYVDFGVHPLPRVALRGGLRLDALSYQTQEAGGQSRSALGAQLGKRGTLDVSILPGLHAVASYGEGFRSPQARSLSNGETTPFTRVVSYEAGLRFLEPDALTASASVFRTLLSEDLVFDQARARNERVPGTERIGLATALAAEPTDWFVSSTSFTYTRADFRESGNGYVKGDLLPYVPQMLTRTDLAFTPKLGRVLGRNLTSHFGAGLTWLARRPLPYSEMGSDVLLLDARAEVRLKEIALGVDAFNLLDREWYDGEFVYASDFSPAGAASLLPVRHVSVGAPRSLMFTASLFI